MLIYSFSSGIKPLWKTEVIALSLVQRIGSQLQRGCRLDGKIACIKISKIQ